MSDEYFLPTDSGLDPKARKFSADCVRNSAQLLNRTSAENHDPSRSSQRTSVRTNSRRLNDMNCPKLQSSYRTAISEGGTSEQEVQSNPLDDIQTTNLNPRKRNSINTNQDQGIKGLNSKIFLHKVNVAAPPLLLTGSDKSRKDFFDKSSTNSDLEASFPKIFANCPDDIRAIFEPCASSRTIFLREKKLVYVCKKVDHRGGLLELENMGISLFVPSGAVPYLQHNLVTLVLNWDLGDNPRMEPREALVSPVVYCGPSGSTFEKPCVLKFKHCAHDTRFLRVLSSQTDLFEDKIWQDFDKVEGDTEDSEEDNEEGMSFQPGVNLSVDECQIELTHFSLYTGIMRSKQRRLKKWIQIAVFTHDVSSELRHQEIRIYFLNKTPCALQWAIQNEASYNFSLACPDTTFLFLESGENMMIHLSYISEGWELVGKDGEDTSRTVFFEQIWHGECPHTFMCFRKVDKKECVTSRSDREDGNSFGADENGSADVADLQDSPKDIDSLPKGCTEINIALQLNQQRCDNLPVPLNILAHNIKVHVSETEVKVIDDGMMW